MTSETIWGKKVEKARILGMMLNSPRLSGAFRSLIGFATSSFEKAVDVSPAACMTPKNIAWSVTA